MQMRRRSSNAMNWALILSCYLLASSINAFQCPSIASSSLSRIISRVSRRDQSSSTILQSVWETQGAATLWGGRCQSQHGGQRRRGVFSGIRLHKAAAGAASLEGPIGEGAVGKVIEGEKKESDLPDLGFLSSKIKIGRFTITPIGVYILISVFFWVAIFYPPLVLAGILSLFTDGGKRMRPVDWVVHYWAWTTMRFIGYNPTVIGAENLPPMDETVMYVPNHTSFLDILTLSGFIRRPFKYISKVEILRIPLIGWAMRISKHIPIRRASKASQIEMVRQAVRHLKNGNSLVTFAEGTRSKTGHVATFKKGAFRIAKEAGVRIVPISICNLHKWMPSGALVPLGVPSDVIIKIHPPVETKDRNENLVWREVFAMVNEGLPEYQRHLEQGIAPSQ